MDPVTQGAVGAALPLATRNRSRVRLAATIGFIAGMAPDLDFLIRAPNDTLFFLEFHRQFSHSLFFIPIGSALIAISLYGLLGSLLSFESY